MNKSIGINISSNKLQAIVLDPGEKPNIVNFLDFDLNVSDFFDSLSVEEEKNLIKNSVLIKDSFKKANISEQDVKVVIPDQICSLQIIKLPLVSEKEIVSAIELQADEFIPYSIENASFDYQILSVNQEEKQMFVLIIVTLKDLIDRVSDFVLDLGLYPTTLEPESTSLYRLFINNNLKVENNLIMLVNIDNKSTQASILNISQKQLITTHNFSVGNSFFLRAIQNNLNLSMQDSTKLFSTVKADDPTYIKIITPTFSEYAKELQKILLASVQQLGSVPKQIFIHSSIAINTYYALFKANNLLGQYNVQTINLQNFNSKININESFHPHFSDIILPLSATI